MHSTLLLALFFCILATQVVAFEPLNSRLLHDLEVELEVEEEVAAQVQRILSRGRRATCGKMLLKMVLNVCGEACTSDSGTDIATKCCAESCSDEFIRTECCP